MPGAALENSIRIHDFDEFAKYIFSSFLRADQRRWAEVYLRGLLSVDGKKTIRKIAEASSANAQDGVIQSLQQFISQSPWDWNPVREALARIVYERAAPHAWILSAATMPKRGSHSVGVTRRFVHQEGRMMNCQRGLGLLLATDCGALPVDWCLELDDVWINEPARRERTRVPNHVDRKSHCDHLLEMVDRLNCHWRMPLAPIVSEFRHSRRDAAKMIAGLTSRKLNFLLEVPASLAIRANVRHTGIRAEGPHTGLGRFRELGSLSGVGAHHFVVEHPGNGRRISSFHAPEIGTPGVLGLAGGMAATLRVLTGWTPNDGRARRFWVTNLLSRRLDELRSLVLLHDRGVSDVQAMQDSFGLRDFEGRSYPGWHHHTTLVSAAFAYHRLSPGGALGLGTDALLRHASCSSPVRATVR